MNRCQNIAEIYEQWKNKEKTIIPKKFKIIEIDGEHSQETELRANLVLFRLTTEISLIQARQSRYKENYMYKSIDEAMFTKFSERNSGQMEIKLKEL